MCETRFTLSWDSFQQNICNGLGALQQNEDLVDMTLAADGHFVRVHQLVLSLASPYIKDLIKSAQSQNPVIFLNRISSKALSSILEYIYTGQVVVAKENIEELLQAAKALHIKGLMDMNYQVNLSGASQPAHTSSLQSTFGHQEKYQTHENPVDDLTDCEDHGMDDPFDDGPDTHNRSSSVNLSKGIQDVAVIKKPNNATKLTPDSLHFQYSLSNQGSLQMILNRFLYYLRYTSKSGHRQWRCTDYGKKKCPASVTTKDDIVLKRTSAHNHPFHDKKIAKKVKANSIFSVMSEAQKKGQSLREKQND